MSSKIYFHWAACSAVEGVDSAPWVGVQTESFLCPEDFSSKQCHGTNTERELIAQIAARTAKGLFVDSTFAFELQRSCRTCVGVHNVDNIDDLFFLLMPSLLHLSLNLFKF